MNPKYYRIKIQVNNHVKTIELVSNSENFNSKRIERELFGSGSVKPYKILKHEVLIEKLGI